jgi:hypothetical protein
MLRGRKEDSVLYTTGNILIDVLLFILIVVVILWVIKRFI